MEVISHPHAPYHSVLDEDIEALALQLEEIGFCDENDKGKYREDELPDYKLALGTFLDEVRTHISFLRDQKLARSVAVAVESDGSLVAAISQDELRAESDRRLARYVDENDDCMPRVDTADDASSRYDVQDARSSVIDEILDDFVSEPRDDEAGPSMTFEAAEKMSKSSFRCSVCYENFQPCKIVKMQCGDLYCMGCLKDLFLRATKDESLFPPRCCRVPIPQSLIQEEMSESELEDFNRAKIEFSTTDRTYCSNTDCGSFISLADIMADCAHCTRCESDTCSMCKNTYHNDDCAADPALQATLALASTQGWQRCFACKAVVELGTGCYHMTCKCKAEFCYVCGVEWRNCSCQMWDEHRLEARAEQVVDREALEPLAPRDRRIRVAQMREDLIENHECEHPGRFQRIFGGGRWGFQCEICENRHWKYILQCRRCHLTVCEECRRHRI